jgi:glycosyltransferase involved in cell wall biosynthesis
MAKVSLLLPVYNVAPYVAEAIVSIQRQTLTDIEVVAIDDCSTDDTLRLVEDIARADSRIRVVRTAHNLGLPEALNFGLQFCNAPFIARMDGDDIALPTRLEKQLRFLEENPGIALVGCATIAVDESGNRVPGLGISRKPSCDEEVARTIILASPCLHIWLARGEVYDRLAGYRNMKYAEDYDFLLRATAAGYRISNLNEPLMLIRTRRGNFSSSIQQRKAHHHIARLYQERLKRGSDSFSLENYAKALRTGKVADAAFRLARRCLQKGIHSRSRAWRLLLSALSALLSPWQARYLFDRIRFRIAMRRPRRISGSAQLAEQVNR